MKNHLISNVGLPCVYVACEIMSAIYWSLLIILIEFSPA